MPDKAQSIDELLGSSPAAPASVDDLLTQQSGGLSPYQVSSRIDLKGDVSQHVVPKTTKEGVRQFATAVAGLGAGAATGGMAFLPSLLIEAGAMGATDYGLKALGLKGEEEAPAFSAEGALESASIPASTLITGGIMRGAQLGLGALGGVGREGLEAIGRRGPFASAKFLKDAPVGAERRIARLVGDYAKELTTGERKLAQMQRAESLIDTVDEIYSNNVLRRRPGGLADFEMHKPQSLSQSVTTRGIMEAERPIPGVIQEGIVKTAPIKAYIQSLRRASFTPEANAENSALNAFADSLPESMTLRDFTSYIRAMRKPVAEQIGKMVNVSLNPADRIRIAAFSSDIRDNILGEAGASMFEVSSRKLQAISDFRRLIVDNSGRLKPNADAQWRNILNANKENVRETFRQFQAETGLPVYDHAIELAARRQWDPPDQKVAVFMMSIIARILRTSSRKLSEGISVFANPRVVPALVAPTDIGSGLGGLALDAVGEAGSAAFRLGAAGYLKGKERLVSPREQQ